MQAERQKVLSVSEVDVKARESALLQQLKEQFEEKLKLEVSTHEKERLALESQCKDQLEPLKSACEKYKKKSKKLKKKLKESEQECAELKQKELKLQCTEAELRKQIQLLEEQIALQKSQSAEQLAKYDLLLKDRERLAYESKIQQEQQSMELINNSQDLNQKLDAHQTEYERLKQKYLELQNLHKMEQEKFLLEQKRSD